MAVATWPESVGMLGSKAMDFEPPPSPQRSALMARIRAKDTKPEMIVRRLLHRHGYRYRLHAKDLPGTPDIVFRRRRKAVFVHGCFWHQHKGCKSASVPKTRVAYWKPKLARNRERDTASLAALVKMGWKAIVVWECQTRNPEIMLRRLVRFLESQAAEGRTRLGLRPPRADGVNTDVKFGQLWGSRAGSRCIPIAFFKELLGTVISGLVSRRT